MPNPTAPPPPPPEKKLPSNLDDLVRKAMTGGGLRALQEALSRSQPEPALPPPPAQPTVVPPLSAAPSPPRAAVAPPISQPSPYTFPDGQSHYHRPPPPPPVPAPPQATPPPPSRPLPPEPEERGTDPGLNLPKKEVSAFDPFAAGDPLPELPAPEQASPAPEFDGSENLFDTDVDPLALLEEAVLAVRGAEFPMVALAEVEQRLDAVYRKLRPQKIVLPPFRFQYLLAVEHAAPETYVSGLGLDLPTARALSATGAPRVALRGDNRLELERRCQKGRALGLRAQVLDKEQLREAMVWLVLSSPAAGKLAVTGEPLWEDPPDPGSWPPRPGAARRRFSPRHSRRSRQPTPKSRASSRTVGAQTLHRCGQHTGAAGQRPGHPQPHGHPALCGGYHPVFWTSGGRSQLSAPQSAGFSGAAAGRRAHGAASPKLRSHGCHH